MPNILSLLQRSDKHALGGSNRLIWAPPFPVFLGAPGLWDPAHYFNFEFGPLFTWTLLDGDAHEIPLQSGVRTWDPAVFTQTFTASVPGGRLTAIESKSILQDDVVTCEVVLRVRGPRKFHLHFVAWTAQEHSASQGASQISDALFRDGTLCFSRQLKSQETSPVSIGAAFALSPETRSYAMQMCEGSIPLPQWNLTPFAEKFKGGQLPEPHGTIDSANSGTVCLALHREATISAGKEETFAIVLALSPTVEGSRRQCNATLKLSSPITFSTVSWNEYFLGMPQFSCSDAYLHRSYWYHWYALRDHTIEAKEGNYQQPVVCSGTGQSRMPDSSSAPAHLRENRWRHDPELARGSLRTFLDHQREDGSIPASIGLNSSSGEALSQWGKAVLDLHAVHPSQQLLRDAYDGLSRYSRYSDRSHDRESSGLYDLNPSQQPGETQTRRLSRPESGGAATQEGVVRIKAVDSTVYMYDLKRSLALMARELGKDGEAELWDIEADKIRNAVRTLMWDPDTRMFFDVDAEEGRRTMVKAAACFLPYGTDIVTAEHLEGLKTHLFNQEEFWSPYPVPSLSMDDESFSPTPDWRGRRVGSPENGRVWPKSNSQLVEATAACALIFEDNALRRKTADLITSFVRMMFFHGDPRLPNCCEHYNPVTGYPSSYRGIDDVESSWMVDLIIKYVCGIRPAGENVIIDPFPFGLKSASIDDVRVREKKLRVEIRQKVYTVWIDGTRYGTTNIGKTMIVPLHGHDLPGSPAKHRS
jgi:hypothetical protein